MPTCSVDACFRREDAQAPDGPDATVVVIDVLRATSTIVTALAAGAAAVHPVDGVDEAREAARSQPGLLLAGERNLRPLPGFDYGNSPGALLDRRVMGRRIVLATTNGSRALAWAQTTGARVLALSLLNLGAVAADLLRSRPRQLLLLGAGADGRPGLDDAYVAGALLARLLHADTQPDAAWQLSERARAALWLHLGAERDAGPGPLAALAQTDPGRRLTAAGYRADVEFCAQVDAFAMVPVLCNGDMVVAAPPSR